VGATDGILGIAFFLTLVIVVGLASHERAIAGDDPGGLSVTVRVDLGEDLGRNVGSLFDAYGRLYARRASGAHVTRHPLSAGLNDVSVNKPHQSSLPLPGWDNRRSIPLMSITPRTAT
jgi:hypothetical protein